MKRLLKRLVPESALRVMRDVQIARLRRRYARLTRAETFADIYKRRVWGADPNSQFCSGSGSRGPAAEAYVKFIREFILRHHIRSVVDLGCGDFFIGSQFVDVVDTYTGVDIVPELISYLNATYGTPRVRFQCCDITSDPLPNADLCLVRQVFQHLSNDEISHALAQLKVYPHVLVTEHFPAESRPVVPNKNKPHGPDTRLIDDSAVFLDQPPFAVAVEQVLSVAAEQCQVAQGETIRTFLIRHGI